jgi:hypothetical protein
MIAMKKQGARAGILLKRNHGIFLKKDEKSQKKSYP